MISYERKQAMIIKNGILVLPDRLVSGGIKLTNGVISEIGEPDGSDEVIDAGGNYISPGLIDIHVHGGGGADFMDCTHKAFRTACDFHLSRGVTTLLPTSVTAPVGLTERFFDTARSEMKTNRMIAGVHAEGPYLSVKNRGAQPERYLRVPAADSYDFLLKNADIIKTVTLSPELPVAPGMIRKLREAGIVVAGGHDDGRKSLITPALEAGLTHLTHLWCAMSLAKVYDGVREPGLLEIGLSDDSLTCEIIADGRHMPPELVKIVWRCKGERMAIVSDCLRAGGMPRDGRLWTLGAEPEMYGEDAPEPTRFIVSDRVARLPDGTRLAGSILSIGEMLKGLVDCGIPVSEAFRAASLTPAKIIGIDRTHGSLEVGKVADIAIFDRGFSPVRVIKDGKTVI